MGKTADKNRRVQPIRSSDSLDARYYIRGACFSVGNFHVNNGPIDKKRREREREREREAKGTRVERKIEPCCREKEKVRKERKKSKGCETMHWCKGNLIF